MVIVVCVAMVSGCKLGESEASRVDVLPYYADATFTPHWLDADDEVLDTLHTVRDFKLTNQLGEPVTAETIRGKVSIVNFFFTICPGICPRMTENMLEVHDVFADNDKVILMSHTVTPTRDSVPVLAAYGQERGIDPSRWHLLTGPQREIYNLGRRSYFIEEDLGMERDDEEFLHTENIVVVDQNRHIRGIYNGLSAVSIQHLIADVRKLVGEQ